MEPSDQQLGDFAEIYYLYSAELRRHNALDFDDLLVYGAELLRKAPGIIKCEHIFVDELYVLPYS